jgi:hypothetical protein
MSLRRFATHLSLLTLLSAVIGVACGGDDKDECAAGSYLCACTPEGFCLGDLTCVANTCVPASGTTNQTTNPGTSNPGTSTDPTTTADPTADPTGGPTTTTDPTGNPTTGETAGSEAGGPKILQLLTNVNTITEGEAVLITAVVTDPDGVDDLIGGSLTSEDGSIGYGAFATSGEEGAYSLSLPWGMIHQAQAIEFETPSIKRVFRAEFFDQGGKSAWKTVELTLNCGDGLRVTPAACGGKCTDLDSDSEHCTKCSIACDPYNDNVGICENSACLPTYMGCVHWEDFTNCNDVCGSFGEVCVQGGCGGHTSGEPDTCEPDDYVYGNYDHPCGEKPSGGGFYTACCCTQTI